MFNLDTFVLSQLFKFHAVKERFIDSIGDSTTERSSMIIFLYFPNSNWINC